jgi:hypothetical protein
MAVNLFVLFDVLKRTACCRQRPLLSFFNKTLPPLTIHVHNHAWKCSEIDEAVHICLYLFDTQRIFLSRIIVRTSFCGLTFPQILKKVMIDDALNLQITPDYR